MQRPDRLVAVGIGAALAIGFLLSQRPHPPHRGPASAEPSTVRAVGVARAETRRIPVIAEAIGTVRSRRQTQIASRVLAEVRTIARGPGERAEAGEELIVLDSLDLKARLEQAEANLAATEESRREAQTEFERARNLLEKEAITQREYDLASSRVSETGARRDAAAKALEEARIVLGYATIVAPFGGVIFEKHADPGDLATPGKPLLGLYDPEELRLEALVDESLLWKLRLKDRLKVTIDALEQPIDGVVSEAVPAVDPSTRTGTIKIDLPRSLDLRPGMFGRARIVTGERDAIVAPRTAVVARGQLELVFVVEGADRPVARMRLVRLGPPLPAEALPPGAPAAGDAEILSGLRPGETVVVDGALSLRDGDPVEVAR